jgi:hypothetical protein
VGWLLSRNNSDLAKAEKAVAAGRTVHSLNGPPGRIVASGQASPGRRPMDGEMTRLLCWLLLLRRPELGQQFGILFRQGDNLLAQPLGFPDLARLDGIGSLDEEVAQFLAGAGKIVAGGRRRSNERTAGHIFCNRLCAATNRVRSTVSPASTRPCMVSTSNRNKLTLGLLFRDASGRSPKIGLIQGLGT